MRKSHLIVLSAILIVTMSTAVMADTTQAPVAPTGVVNINSADAAQLAYLPRVGVKAAQRIIDYRKEHGGFKKTSDLMQVKGFGEKSYERLAAYLTVDGKTTLATKVHPGRLGGGKRAKSAKSSSSSPTPATR
ncbi:MAG: competence protein ComEA [Thermoanaerobaculia bacterium]|jgi:competence protein ComEA|nr:competence protein ComEA [Thermoanaerobaculia bacterium]